MVQPSTNRSVVAWLRTLLRSHRQVNRRNDARANQNVSVIAAGARVIGDVHTTGVVQVAGSVVGNVRAGRQVLVAKGGVVDGDIESPEAVIGGEVRGRVRATHRVAGRTGRSRVQMGSLGGSVARPPARQLRTAT